MRGNPICDKLKGVCALKSDRCISLQLITWQLAQELSNVAEVLHRLFQVLCQRWSELLKTDAESLWRSATMEQSFCQRDCTDHLVRLPKVHQPRLNQCQKLVEQLKGLVLLGRLVLLQKGEDQAPHHHIEVELELALDTGREHTAHQNLNHKE